MNVINLIGIFPFLVIFLYYDSFISFTVLINGILYHGLSREYKNIDIIFNSICILFVNLYSNFKYTNFITLISLLLFLTNRIFVSNYFHLFFVQMPFAYLLYEYYNNIY